MPSRRDEFLDRVRQAVLAGNQAGQGRGLPSGPRVAYQGGGPDPVERFASELANAGGRCHRVADARQAIDRVIDLVSQSQAKKALLARISSLPSGQLASSLRVRGIEVWEEVERPFDPSLTELPAESVKRVLFEADVGITGVDALIAETGSIVLTSRPGQARSLSLLPPLHIAVANREQLIPDLFDLFDSASAIGETASAKRQVASAPALALNRQLPSCVTLITGPSKTGDIELKLVTGVHGPGEVHVVLIDSGA
jgi:L-lactate utilization protein LutC